MQDDKLTAKTNDIRPAISESQLRLLSRSSQIEEATPSKIARFAMIVLSSGVFAAIALAAISNINEIARGDGLVEPLGLERDIQHATGGFIAELHTRDGEFVEEGQPIIRLSDTNLEKDLARARHRSQTLNVQIKVHQSYLEDNFTALEGLRPEDRATAIEANEARRAAFQDQASAIQEQHQQRLRDSQLIRQQIEFVIQRLKVASEIADQREELWKKGYVTKIAYLDAQQNLTALQSELGILRTRSRSAKAAEAEYLARIAALTSGDRSSTIQSLNRLIAQGAENDELVSKLEAQREALVVRATTRGILNGMKYASIGGLVQPATTITKIIPTDEDLVVRARIQPKDIGRIQVGSEVRLRFDNYDFERFGAVEGAVTAVSAASFLDEAGRLYYNVLISPVTTYLSENQQENPIQVGMSASAEIITGRRTILQYLLQPIRAALSTAITES